MPNPNAIDVPNLVQRKADDIRKAFKNWIFRDADRRENIVQRYNELFNSIRPREFDGSAISFPMMTADIKLHDHQKNAIAHALFGGNTLFQKARKGFSCKAVQAQAGGGACGRTCPHLCGRNAGGYAVR